MGSSDSHFDVSLMERAQSRDSAHKPQLVVERDRYIISSCSGFAVCCGLSPYGVLTTELTGMSVEGGGGRGGTCSFSGMACG